MTRRQTGQLLMFFSYVGGVLVWGTVAAGLMVAFMTSRSRGESITFFVLSGIYCAISAFAMSHLGKWLRDSKGR